MTTSDDKKHERVKITWEQKQLTYENLGIDELEADFKASIKELGQ